MMVRAHDEGMMMLPYNKMLNSIQASTEGGEGRKGGSNAAQRRCGRYEAGTGDFKPTLEDQQLLSSVMSHPHHACDWMNRPLQDATLWRPSW